MLPFSLKKCLVKERTSYKYEKADDYTHACAGVYVASLVPPSFEFCMCHRGA